MLKIKLLGSARLTVEEKPLTGLSSRKAVALLAYLAVQQRPFPREVLADLLWDDRPQDQALANLRSILSSLRSKLKPYLHIARDEVAFNLESDYWLDTAVFHSQLTPLLASIGQEEVLAETAVSQLTTALNLYQGNFLAGFFITDSIGFDEWATVQRERYQRLAILALHQLANHYINSGQYQAGLEIVPRLLQIDPLNETAQRQMMTLLARSGQRHAALQQYKNGRQLLAQELSVEPSPPTKALYQRIKRAPEQPPFNLPRTYNPLIGREKELAQIISRLHRPSCRLLTLLGSGGIGKTRLATAVAQQLAGSFLDGIYFIPLASLETAVTLLPIFISEILNLPLSGNQSPARQLQQHLQDKELLLIADNAEHLLDQLDLLLDLLHTAPHIKLLVTSRERFNVQMEWLLPIQGLPYPHNGDSLPTRYPAEILFSERAAKVGADLQWVGETETAVRHICQLVDGNPLGLELAAAATYTHTPVQIASQISHNLDFLATTLRDVPQRHRSLRAVFESSWQLLAANEQQLFSRLCFFRGGFTAEAAQAVADISPTLLTNFVHKSLLQVLDNGRYDLHDLLRQFTTEKLSATESTQYQQKHNNYFSHFLANRNAPLRGERQKEVLDEIMADIENIRTFWHQATAQPDLAVIGRSLVTLYRFYDATSWFQEGYQAFKTAVAALQPLAPSLIEADAITYAHLLSRQGWFLSRLDRRAEAADYMQQSLDLHRQLGHVDGEAIALNDLGIITYRLGDYARSYQLGVDSLKLARTHNDQWKVAVILTNLGNICRAMGNYTQAKVYLFEGIAIMRQKGDQHSLGNLINNLGEVTRASGQYGEAEAYYEESLALRRQVGDQLGIAESLNNLASIAHIAGHQQQAQQLYQESLAIFHQLKADNIAIHPLCGLGRLARDAGDYQQAFTWYQKALQWLKLENNTPNILTILFEVVTVLVKMEAEIDLAHSLLHLVHEHPKTYDETRQACHSYLALGSKQPTPLPLEQAIAAVMTLTYPAN